MLIMLLLMALLVLPQPVKAAAIADVEAAVMDKDYAKGRELAAMILKQTADKTARVNAQYYLGLCQLRLGQSGNARNTLQIVMSAAPNEDLYEKAALGMIEALYVDGFYKDALKDGRRLLSRYPASPSKSLIYLKIARASLKLMKWDDARLYLKKVITEFPQSFEAPIAKGLLEEKEFFAVQVGAFLDRVKALKLAEELKAKDQYAYIVETTSTDGKKFYRVRVGQMTSLDHAQNVQSQLSRQGYPSLIYP